MQVVSKGKNFHVMLKPISMGKIKKIKMSSAESVFLMFPRKQALTFHANSPQETP